MKFETLEDVGEAILGAIHLDQGFEAACAWFIERLAIVASPTVFQPAKTSAGARTLMQQYCEDNKLGKVEFRLSGKQSYSDPYSVFPTNTCTVELWLGGEVRQFSRLVACAIVVPLPLLFLCILVSREWRQVAFTACTGPAGRLQFFAH